MKRHVIFYALALPLMFVRLVVDTVRNLFATPVAYLVRTTRVDGSFNLFPPIKLIALRIIGQLKPVYRESWLTDGLNLDSRLRPA